MFSASWIPVTPCTCVSLETAKHTSTGWGPVLAISKHKSVVTGRSLSWLRHLETSDGDLCQHIILLCFCQPRGRRRQGQSSAIQIDLTDPTSRYSDTVHPNVLKQHGSGDTTLQRQCKCQRNNSSTDKCKVHFGKAKSTGLISSMAQKRPRYRVTVGRSLVLFVIHAERCYPQQRNRKSVWRAVFWFGAMQTRVIFPLMWQNSEICQKSSISLTRFYLKQSSKILMKN